MRYVQCLDVLLPEEMKSQNFETVFFFLFKISYEFKDPIKSRVPTWASVESKAHDTKEQQFYWRPIEPYKMSVLKKK